LTDKLETISPVQAYTQEKLAGIYSKLLGRDIEVELFLPVSAATSKKKYPLLLLNDGQDSTSVRVLETVEKLTQNGTINEIVVAAITAGDRMQEYGVASKPDYLKRGTKAKAYTKYIISELIPYLLYKYPVSSSPADHAIAGYSMGGLSALDIAWAHPEVFTKAGVFSGSLWWRKRDSKSRFYSENRDRIMHQLIRHSKFRKGLKFWFQSGTQDEQSDRNKNGVIDSIDDTLDLIVELTKKGYRPFHDIQYLEIKDGKHNTQTWAEAMPHFLSWAFGK
jgi:enterochelin esterase-like enzyme